MKQSIFILGLLFSQADSIGQQSPKTIFKINYSADSARYSKTNYQIVDTLSKWNYTLIPSAKLYPNSNLLLRDSLFPIMAINFYRTAPLTDSIGYYKIRDYSIAKSKKHRLDKKYETFLKEHISFKPSICFYIYNISDSIHCNNESKSLKELSNCIAPQVGGDLFIIGKFIFLNPELCLSCGTPFYGKLDYCRPLINFIFSKLDYKNVETIQSIVNQLPIRKLDE